MPDNHQPRRCPIAFDHHSPEHANAWPQIFQKLRQENSLPWSDAFGGYWVAARYRDIIKIAQRPGNFFVKKTYNPDTGATTGGVAIPPNPAFSGIPNELDSPEWDLFRKFLNPRFGPKAVEDRRQRAKVLAAALIDMVIENGTFDIVDDLTSPLPALVSMDLFGFPLDDWRKFADPFHKMVYTRRDDPGWEETVRGLGYYQQRLAEEVETMPEGTERRPDHPSRQR